MATGGRSLVNNRNQKPNQKKLPTMMPISTTEGRYTPHAKGSYSCESDTTTITNGELLETECDILIPAAMENQIHGDNAGNVRAKLIVEAANGPMTPRADAILDANGIIVLPDHDDAFALRFEAGNGVELAGGQRVEAAEVDCFGDFRVGFQQNLTTFGEHRAHQIATLPGMAGSW